MVIPLGNTDMSNVPDSPGPYVAIDHVFDIEIREDIGCMVEQFLELHPLLVGYDFESLALEEICSLHKIEL